MKTRKLVATLFQAAIYLGLFGVSTSGWAEEPRVEKGAASVVDGQRSAKKDEVQEHPLDPVLDLAREGLEHIRKDVRDYTTTLVRRERIDGKLTEQEFTFCKIRNRKVEDDKLIVPFAIYMKFLKPKSVAGREVIWVEGANDGKLIAHEVPGPLNLIRAKLDPLGRFAMKGNRYPISDSGIEALVEGLIENGERDRKRGECEVLFYKNAKINGRVCTMLEVKHPVKREYFNYHLAQIFVDDELNVPLRYAAYSWPTTRGGTPVLEEEYTYMDMRLNVGLTDEDFNPDNKAYQFP